MWNKPTDEELARMPRLYETEGIPLEDKIIHQHYFIGGSDWYMGCPFLLTTKLHLERAGRVYILFDDSDDCTANQLKPLKR